MDGHAGMAELRRAEDEASRIVEEARKARAARMKQAKADAAKDIDAFRQEHMKELEKIKAEKTGASGGSDAARNAEAKSNEEIKLMEQQFHDNQGKVVEVLLNATLNVPLKIPEARKGLMKM